RDRDRRSPVTGQGRHALLVSEVVEWITSGEKSNEAAGCATLVVDLTSVKLWVTILNRRRRIRCNHGILLTLQHAHHSALRCDHRSLPGSTQCGPCFGADSRAAA